MTASVQDSKYQGNDRTPHKRTKYVPIISNFTHAMRSFQSIFIYLLLIRFF